MQRTDEGEHGLRLECRQGHVAAANVSDGIDGERVHQMEHGSDVAPDVAGMQPHLCEDMLAKVCRTGQGTLAGSWHMLPGQCDDHAETRPLMPR